MCCRKTEGNDEKRTEGRRKSVSPQPEARVNFLLSNCIHLQSKRSRRCGVRVHAIQSLATLGDAFGTQPSEEFGAARRKTLPPPPS